MTMEYRYLRKAQPDVTDEGKLHGRAWPYNSWTQIGKAPWGFKEKLREGAGKKSINDGDIVLLDNHDTRLPLARMSAGTLEMRDSKSGGDWEASVTDTSYAQDVVKNVRVKNYGGCSFGFEVIKDIWTDDDGNPATPMDGTRREIVEFKAHEISVCTFPAYTATTVSARAQVNTARGVEDERFASMGMSDLMQQSPHDEPPEKDDEDEELSDEATTNEGTQKPMMGEQASAYADPGYQEDGKKRYPVDSERHAKSSWAFINQARNAAKYTARQLASIKSKIKTALREFGVKVSTTEAKEWESLCDFREMTEGYSPEGDLNEVDFGVMPDGFVRSDDANALAAKIRESASAEDRVACIELASDLNLAELLPVHWGSAGEIGAGASDDVRRDMDDIYTLALSLPPTRTALDILNRAQPYLSEATRQAKEEAEPEEEPETSTLSLADARQRLQEAQERHKGLSRTR